MDTYELVVPCHFGLEAVTKREIYDLGYEITRVEDGRVTFAGDAEAICRANIFLRSAERVLLQVGRFRATTFDELFEGIKALPWEDYIPKDGKFWVKKASSIQSVGYSVNCKKGDGRASEECLPAELVSGGWSTLSGTHFPVKG